jgi:hypothetical protein
VYLIKYHVIKRKNRVCWKKKILKHKNKLVLRTILKLILLVIVDGITGIGALSKGDIVLS